MTSQYTFQQSVNRLENILSSYDRNNSNQITQYTRTQNDLNNMKHLLRLRDEILSIPTEKDQIFTRTDWHISPAGTPVKEIKAWYESTFRVEFD